MDMKKNKNNSKMRPMSSAFRGVARDKSLIYVSLLNIKAMIFHMENLLYFEID